MRCLIFAADALQSLGMEMEMKMAARVAAKAAIAATLAISSTEQLAY